MARVLHRKETSPNVEELILLQVKKIPGTSIQSLAKTFGLSHASMRRRVTNLRKKGKVQTLRAGNQVLVYDPSSTNWQHVMLFQIVSSGAGKRIVETFLTVSGGLTINQIAKEADVSFGVAKRRLSWLEVLDLVQVEREGHSYVVQRSPGFVELVSKHISGFKDRTVLPLVPDGVAPMPP